MKYVLKPFRSSLYGDFWAAYVSDDDEIKMNHGLKISIRQILIIKTLLDSLGSEKKTKIKNPLRNLSLLQVQITFDNC